ncbi:MAG: bifunctional 3-(3-hydroxy-phenyl)propionate/3-hydroxycinnamic acid hydroxylase [Chloroflexota bacterium]|nr:bifunctional 3-(3-hydroxy-phenyl)propionate/3-hydroxycinnamic acid hydroxylase [Chloroflexota bacterium]
MTSSMSEEPQVHYPVVIVGAGPTGLVLANLLGGEGIRTLLIERYPSTGREPRAVSLDDESLRTLQTLGLASEVLQHVVPGYGSQYYSPGGRCFVKVEPSDTPYGYPRRNAFRQPILERQLREGLERFSHIETRFGSTLETLAQDASGVVIGITGPEDLHTRIACDYLIGCDGASSTVRNLLGISLAGSTFHERWLIIDLENSDTSSPHTKVFCDPRRPCISLPGPDRTHRFEFKLHSHERDEALLIPEVIQNLLHTHGADPNSTIVRKVVYRFHARLADHWSKGRVFLAGDAAHLSPPFAGQGMNSGIRDAHNLAWKLAWVLRGQLGPHLLDTYERERRAHTSAMIRLALQMGSVMAPRHFLSAWAVQNMFRVLGLFPAAQAYVSQMKYKPKPRFLAGFLVSPGQRRSQTIVGSLFPQPFVETKEGKMVLLDDVLGNGFSLLALTAQPELAFAFTTQPIWSYLGVQRVALLPVGTPWRDTSEITLVRERDQALMALRAKYADSVLLLRPDHYVAARMPVAEIAQRSDLIEALLHLIDRNGT